MNSRIRPAVLRQSYFLRIFFVLALTVANAGAETKDPTTYLCIPDQSTGFNFDKQARRWVQTNFNVKDRKYLLALTDGKWYWDHIGHERDQRFVGCGHFDDDGLLMCHWYGEDVRFNRKTLRFLSTRVNGYAVSNLDDEKDGPYWPVSQTIEIGTCSPL